eukprot:jgi/Botrbrau1/11544/Bobra.0393s0022.1
MSKMEHIPAVILRAPRILHASWKYGIFSHFLLNCLGSFWSSVRDPEHVSRLPRRSRVRAPDLMGSGYFTGPHDPFGLKSDAYPPSKGAVIRIKRCRHPS